MFKIKVAKSSVPDPVPSRSVSSNALKGRENCRRVFMQVGEQMGIIKRGSAARHSTEIK